MTQSWAVSKSRASGLGIGRADGGLLRTGSDEDCGEGLEVFDELVELVRLENVVGRSGEFVGERFDHSTRSFVAPIATSMSRRCLVTTSRSCSWLIAAHCWASSDDGCVSPSATTAERT